MDTPKAVGRPKARGVFGKCWKLSVDHLYVVELHLTALPRARGKIAREYCISYCYVVCLESSAMTMAMVDIDDFKGFAPRKRSRASYPWRREVYPRRLFGGRRAVARPRRRRRRNLRTAGYLGIELKFLDVAWNGVALATSTDGSGGELQPSTGCTGAISVPAQGDGESERDGRKFTMKNVYLSGNITTTAQSDQADVAEFQGYYFALVLDTQANAATVVSEDVYLNPSTSHIAMLPKPLRNLQNSKRFKILDSVFCPPGGAYAFNDAAATASMSNQVAPNITLSWSGEIACNCVGTTANVASVSDNAIHLLAYTGSTAAVPTFFGKARTRFVG